MLISSLKNTFTVKSRLVFDQTTVPQPSQEIKLSVFGPESLGLKPAPPLNKCTALGKPLDVSELTYLKDGSRICGILETLDTKIMNAQSVITAYINFK